MRVAQDHRKIIAFPRTLRRILERQFGGTGNHVERRAHFMRERGGDSSDAAEAFHADEGFPQGSFSGGFLEVALNRREANDKSAWGVLPQAVH